MGAAREARVSRVDAPRAALLAAIAAHVLGWLLPAAADVRGYRAFGLAVSPLWAREQFADQPAWFLILIVASALTNVLFVGLAVLLWRRARPKAVLWAAAAATLLDLHWVVTLHADRRYLTTGYFSWVVSFALLALAAFLTLRSRPR
jgi:hypothetical protein